jgi:hypothetical protein
MVLQATHREISKVEGETLQRSSFFGVSEMQQV